VQNSLIDTRDGVCGPDLLKVNAEGYDYQVLSMLDLDHHCPTIIHFEHRHIFASHYESVIARLQKYGYLFFADKMIPRSI
jgi:hypothetical protein